MTNGYGVPRALSLLFILAYFLCAGFPVFGQTEAELKKYRYQPTEDEQKKSGRGIGAGNIRPTEKFDLIFNYGFLVTNNMPDGFEVRPGSSGSRFVGVSLNYIFSHKLMAKVQPGFTFFKLNFRENAIDTLGSAEPVTNDLKLRAEYLDLPVGLTWVLKEDTVKNKFLAYVDVGATVGYRIGSSYKFVTGSGDDRVKIKIPGIEDVQRWRFALFAKAAYSFGGVWVLYRLNDFFHTDRQDSEGVPHPEFSKLEIGFSIVL